MPDVVPLVLPATWGAVEWSLGVDLGGTSAKVAIVGADGTVVAHDSVPTGAACEWSAFLAALAACADRVTQGAGLSRTSLGAVGVASAGLIEQSTGVLRSSPNLPLFHDVPVRDTVRETFACPVAIENDATAFAFGEWASGAARGARHAVFVTLGTGVGGGVVVNGALHRGAHGFAGEIGHTCVSIAPDAPLCACGRTGCVEAYVGANALVARARAHDAAIASPADITARAAAGAEPMRRVLADAGAVLGVALGNMVNTLDPEVLVVGGGVARAGELLLAPAEEMMCRRALSRGTVPYPPLRPSAHGDLAGAIGAALVARASA